MTLVWDMGTTLDTSTVVPVMEMVPMERVVVIVAEEPVTVATTVTAATVKEEPTTVVKGCRAQPKMISVGVGMGRGVTVKEPAKEEAVGVLTVK